MLLHFESFYCNAVQAQNAENSPKPPRSAGNSLKVVNQSLQSTRIRCGVIRLLAAVFLNCHHETWCAVLWIDGRSISHKAAVKAVLCWGLVCCHNCRQTRNQI